MLRDMVNAIYAQYTENLLKPTTKISPPAQMDKKTEKRREGQKEVEVRDGK